LIKSQREAELELKEWKLKVERWRRMLGNRRDAPRAAAEIRDAKHPLAELALAELLKREENPAIKQFLIERLHASEAPAATDAIIELAIRDPDARVRERCIDRLAKNGRKRAVRAFLQLLDAKDNRMVNWAGIALGRLGDSQAIVPLIDALNTEHKFILQQGRSPGQIGAGFGQGAGSSGGGFSAGGKRRVVTQELKNRGVLDGLLLLVNGANFQYDEDAWKAWYVKNHEPAHVDLRRGP